MNDITIKRYDTDGIVEVEMYDTDTDGVGVLVVKAPDLRCWLEHFQPCRVHLHINDDSLRRLVCNAGDLFQMSIWTGQAGARAYDAACYAAEQDLMWEVWELAGASATRRPIAI